MERLRGSPLQPGIHRSVAVWHEAVTSVQEKRRDEVVNAITQRHNPLPSTQNTSEQGKLYYIFVYNFFVCRLICSWSYSDVLYIDQIKGTGMV